MSFRQQSELAPRLRRTRFSLQVSGTDLEDRGRPLCPHGQRHPARREFVQHEQQRRRRLLAAGEEPRLLEEAPGGLPQPAQFEVGGFRAERQRRGDAVHAVEVATDGVPHSWVPIELSGHLQRAAAFALDAALLQRSQFGAAPQLRGTFLPHTSGIQPAALGPRTLLARTASVACHPRGVARVHPRASDKGQSGVQDPGAASVSCGARTEAEGAPPAATHEDRAQRTGTGISGSVRQVPGK